MKLITIAVVALAVTAANAEVLDNPYGHCDQQTLDEAVALDRLPGDKEFLRDHLRSFGCRLIWPREGLQQFPPEPRDKDERRHAPR
jgi:hypothetical protein